MRSKLGLRCDSLFHIFSNIVLLLLLLPVALTLNGNVRDTLLLQFITGILLYGQTKHFDFQMLGTASGASWAHFPILGLMAIANNMMFDEGGAAKHFNASVFFVILGVPLIPSFLSVGHYECWSNKKQLPGLFAYALPPARIRDTSLDKSSNERKSLALK